MRGLSYIAICGLLILLIVGSVSAYTENFQNFPVGTQNPGYWVSVGAGTHCDVVATPYTDTLALSESGYYFGYTEPVATNYWAFTMTNGATTPKVKILDVGGSQIFVGDLPAGTAGRYVITRENGHLYYSINGAAQVDMGSCGTTQPYYIQFYSLWTGSFVVDDVVIGSSITDVVGLPPHTWFVGKDLLDPSVKGLFDASYNNIYTDHFHYTISNSTGSSVQNYSMPDPPTSGTITITSGAASDYITCRAVVLSGTDVSWQNSTYAANDLATYNWTVSTQYWDTTQYDYKVKVYEYANGTTTLVQTKSINTANGTNTYQTTTDGIYTAALILDYKTAPNTDFWLDSDWMEVFNGITINGYCYDGYVYQPLSGVNVQVSQSGGTSYNATTDSSGFYQISNGTFSTGLQLSWLGTKVNYTPGRFNYTFITPGTAQVDLTLMPIIYVLPDPQPIITHNNTAIGGYVKTNDGYYLTGAVVGITNGSYTNSYTVTPSGIYLFDNLMPQSTYTINCTKSGYVTVSSSVSTGELNSITYYSIEMYPESGTVNGTTVAGFVIDAAYGSPIATSTVNLSNLSWSSLTSSSAQGFYQYGQLETGAPYNLSASKTGYSTANGSLTTGASNSISYYNFYMSPTEFDSYSGAALGGYIIDASTLGSFAGALVTVSNDTYTSSQYSSATGTYLFDNLTESSQYTLTASYTNYTTATKTATTGLTASLIYTNLYLSPGGVVNGTSIYGNVLSTPYNLAVNSSTVTCNGKTVTTDAGGFFKIEGLNASTTYSCYASCPTYNSATVDVTTGTPNSATNLNIYLGQTFAVTVHVIDSLTNSTINNATVTINGGDSQTLTNGYITYLLAYGSYTIGATATNYYENSQDVYVGNNKTIALYLTPTSSNNNINLNNLGPGQAYPPHNVRFTIQSVWGVPIKNATVTCIGTETTAGSFQWLYDIFGFNSTATPIANTTLTGTTDHLGGINFMMFEAVRYNMTINATGYANKTFDFYPKDEYYVIPMEDMSNATWYQGGYNIQEVITSNVTGDETTGNITVNYADALGSTTGGIVWLNQTNKTNITSAETSLANYTITTANFTHVFTTTNYKGQSYIIRIRANSSVFTQQIARDYGVAFRKEQVNPMNLSDFELMLISVFLLIFLGCFFGAVQAPQGPILVCFVGWILWGIGWMNAAGSGIVVALTLATVISVAVLIMVRSRKGTWF